MSVGAATASHLGAASALRAASVAPLRGRG
jgi:hypothetical protein